MNLYFYGIDTVTLQIVDIFSQRWNRFRFHKSSIITADDLRRKGGRVSSVIVLRNIPATRVRSCFKVRVDYLVWLALTPPWKCISRQVKPTNAICRATLHPDDESGPPTRCWESAAATPRSLLALHSGMSRWTIAGTVLLCLGKYNIPITHLR